MSPRALLTVLVVLGTAGCDSMVDGATTSATTGTSTSDSESSSDGPVVPMMTTTSTTAAVDSTTSASTEDDGGYEEDDGGTGCTFTCPDPPPPTPPPGGGGNGGGAFECDLQAQDCPEGEKCMPWANDGGGSWNATRCSPIDENPGQPGDTCTVEGDGVSGVDDCDIAAMCWDVDGKSNMGVCVGFCEGSEDAPFCSNPDEGCSITNDGVLILCLAICDPLLQDCPEGSACYPEDNGFFCSPDASGAELGAIGDPCEYINVCDPGGWCAAAESVPDCVASSGCCAAFCDITDPASTCPDGTECVAWHTKGTAPPGEEDIGVCILPQT